jgi:hypothetical protein
MIIYISWFVTRPYSNMTQCLRTLASPKGRGGMLSGRLKYIIKKNYIIVREGYTVLSYNRKYSVYHCNAVEK